MTTKSMIFLCLALGSSAALSAQSDRKTDTLGKEMKVRKEVKIIVEEDGTERRTEKIITTKSNKSDIVNEDKDVKIELNTKKNDPKKYSVRGNRRTKLYLDMATGINILSQQNSVIGRFYPEQDLWRSWFFDIGFVFKTRLNTSVASPITFNYGINFMLNHFDWKENAVLSTNKNLPSQFINNTNTTLVFSDNDLYINYVSIPIGVEFKLGKNAPRIGIGAYAGIRMNSYERTNFTVATDEIDIEQKASHRFGLTNFMYGVRANFTLNNGLGLFGRYDLSSLFEKNEINDYRIGAVGLHWIF